VSYKDGNSTIYIENDIIRSLNNIINFNINKDDDNYKVILEKKEKGKITTVINFGDLQDY